MANDPAYQRGLSRLFLFGGAFHFGSDFRQFSRQSLALIQGLGADFARVVDPHQSGYVTLIRFRPLAIRESVRWIRAFGDLRAPEYRAQGLIHAHQQVVQRRVMAVVHGYAR